MGVCCSRGGVQAIPSSESNAARIRMLFSTTSASQKTVMCLIRTREGLLGPEERTKKDLNAIQARYAYGIESQEQLGKNKFGMIMAALKNRKIIVERIAYDYKAIMMIAGRRSILDRVYVKSEEGTFWPKVACIDLFGRVVETNSAVNERISP